MRSVYKSATEKVVSNCQQDNLKGKILRMMMKIYRKKVLSMQEMKWIAFQLAKHLQSLKYYPLIFY